MRRGNSAFISAFNSAQVRTGGWWSSAELNLVTKLLQIPQTSQWLLVKGFLGNIGMCEVIKTELWTIQKGMEMAWVMTLPKISGIWLQNGGDTYSPSYERQPPPSCHDSWLEEAPRMPWEVTVQHMMANMGHDIASDMEMFEDHPPWAAPLLMWDLLGLYPLLLVCL